MYDFKNSSLLIYLVFILFITSRFGNIWSVQLFHIQLEIAIRYTLTAWVESKQPNLFILTPFVHHEPAVLVHARLLTGLIVGTEYIYMCSSS